MAHLSYSSRSKQSPCSSTSSPKEIAPILMYFSQSLSYRNGTIGCLGLGSPVLDDIIGACCQVIGVISPEDHPSRGGQGLLKLVSPVHLELSIIFDVLQRHECLDSRTQVPTAAEYLIPTQMEIGRILEQTIPLSKNLLGQGIDFLLGHIKLMVIVFAPWAQDCDIAVLPFLGQTPRSYVAGCVEFGDYAHCIYFGEVDELFYIFHIVRFLGRVSAGFGQFRMFDHVEHKSLIIGEQPVHNIKLRQRHSLNKFPYILDPNKMPHGINHDAPVGDNGLVLDLAQFYLIAVYYHLGESFQGVDVTRVAGRGDLDERWLAFYFVALGVEGRVVIYENFVGFWQYISGLLALRQIDDSVHHLLKVI